MMYFVASRCDFLCVCVSVCVCKKKPSNHASKKVLRQIQTLPYSNARRLPERQPRDRTVWTRNSCSSSSWGTVRDFCRKKLTRLWFGVKTSLDFWILANKLYGLLNIVDHGVFDCLLSKGRRSDTLWAKARRIVFISFFWGNMEGCPAIDAR